MEDIMRQGLGEQARRHTYCLIVDDVEIGTAVAVKLGGRPFLATAAHLIKGKSSIKVLLRNQQRQYISDFAAQYCIGDTDVAFLEPLSKDCDKLEFVSEDRLWLDNEPETGLSALVVGYPSQLLARAPEMELTNEFLISVVCCQALTFFSNILPETEWPPNGLAESLVHGHDLLIDYDPEHKLTPFGPQTAGSSNAAIACSSLAPQGMSGGGIWLARISESSTGLQCPDAHLVGLQLGWYCGKKLLHGLRIKAWIELAHSVLNTSNSG